MERSKLEKFINRYNLGGACESVLLVVDDDLSVRAISDDKNVLAEVTAASMGLENGEYAVYETQRLRSLLGVLGEQLKVKVNKSGQKSTSIKFSDGDTDVTFVLADKGVIPVTPDLKKLPAFDLVIDMDEKFINTFIKAKGALMEVDTFTVISDKGKTQIIIGYSSMNTNRVSLNVEANKPADITPVNFSAKYLREILVANKDAKAGKLEISSKGLARTSFSVDNITSTYYLVQIDALDG